MDDSVGRLGVLHSVLGSSFKNTVARRARPARAINECDLLEEQLLFVLDQISLLHKLDEMWNADVTFGRIAYEDSDEQEISGYYRNWLVAAEIVAAELAARQSSGCVPDSAAAFLAELEEVRGICTPDEVFFSGPKLEALEARAIAAYHAGETVEIQDLGD